MYCTYTVCKLVSLLTSLCRLIGCAIWGLLEVRTYIHNVILSKVSPCLLGVQVEQSLSCSQALRMVWWTWTHTACMYVCTYMYALAWLLCPPAHLPDCVFYIISKIVTRIDWLSNHLTLSSCKDKNVSTSKLFISSGTGYFSQSILVPCSWRSSGPASVTQCCTPITRYFNLNIVQYCINYDVIGSRYIRTYVCIYIQYNHYSLPLPFPVNSIAQRWTWHQKSWLPTLNSSKRTT